MGRKIDILKRVPKFVLVNAAGTVVDNVVLWLFSHYVFHSYVGDYLLSPLISFECAVFTNFCFSFFFIWKDRVEYGNMRAFFKKYAFYNISSSMTFLIKMGFLLLFELLFGWNVVICNLAALCISGTINFSMGEWVIFKKRN
jgi:putative flippase GtrA